MFRGTGFGANINAQIDIPQIGTRGTLVCRQTHAFGKHIIGLLRNLHLTQNDRLVDKQKILIVRGNHTAQEGCLIARAPVAQRAHIGAELNRRVGMFRLSDCGRNRVAAEPDSVRSLMVCRFYLRTGPRSPGFIELHAGIFAQSESLGRLLNGLNAGTVTDFIEEIVAGNLQRLLNRQGAVGGMRRRP